MVLQQMLWLNIADDIALNRGCLRYHLENKRIGTNIELEVTFLLFSERFTLDKGYILRMIISLYLIKRRNP